MLYFNSYDKLFQQILTKLSSIKKEVILIGGCSRTGKSYLSETIKTSFIQRRITCKIVNIDAWIVSLEKRKPGATVMERFDCDAIVKDIKALLSGKTVYPPQYDYISRKRIQEKGQPLQIVDTDIIIIEGVIALSIKALLELAHLKIYLSIPDETRIARLIDFYVNSKSVNIEKAKHIIFTRENEEVLFVKKSKASADIVYEQ